jgi:hypothetical protein
MGCGVGDPPNAKTIKKKKKKKKKKIAVYLSLGHHKGRPSYLQ